MVRLQAVWGRLPQKKARSGPQHLYLRRPGRQTFGGELCLLRLQLRDGARRPRRRRNVCGPRRRRDLHQRHLGPGHGHRHRRGLGKAARDGECARRRNAGAWQRGSWLRVICGSIRISKAGTRRKSARTSQVRSMHRDLESRTSRRSLCCSFHQMICRWASRLCTSHKENGYCTMA